MTSYAPPAITINGTELELGAEFCGQCGSVAIQSKRKILNLDQSTSSADNSWKAVVTELVAVRGDAISNYALALCGNEEDAADLVQDALIRTFGRLRNGFTIDSAEAYVRKAILNGYLDRARRLRVWRRIMPLTVAESEVSSATEAVDSKSDLVEQLKILSPRERACIVLRYLEDQKVDDVAANLGLSPGSAKRYISDALRKLQINYLESELGGEK